MPKPDQMKVFENSFVNTVSQILPPPMRNYETLLTPGEEKSFGAWKGKYAPKDSGADYDLRGAYKAGLTPDATTGHWPDTFKKPNHPTFSTQSQYAKFAPHLAGTWGGSDGETYIPPAPIDLSTGLPATQPPPGSNIINPYAVTLPPPPNMQNVDFGKAGTINHIYPEAR